MKALSADSQGKHIRMMGYFPFYSILLHFNILMQLELEKRTGDVKQNIFFVLKIWSNQKKKEIFAEGRFQLHCWPLGVPLSAAWTQNLKKHIPDSGSSAGVQKCEFESYFLQKGIETSFSLPIKCIAKSKVPDKGQLLFKPQEWKKTQNKRLSTRIYYWKEVWHFKFKFSPIHVSPYFLLWSKVHHNTQPHQFSCSSWRKPSWLGVCARASSWTQHSSCTCTCPGQGSLWKENKWMETNSQQGCCPLREKLTGAISLINSKNKEKKKQGRSKQLIELFHLICWSGFLSPSTVTNLFWFESLLYDIFSTTLIRSILTCN